MLELDSGWYLVWRGVSRTKGKQAWIARQASYIASAIVLNA